jgi:tellurite resistance protein TerA
MAHISLEKGSVRLTKDRAIRVRILWPAATDYDAGAEILYKDGTTESIATFGAKGVEARTTSRNGTVRHSGDAVRGAGTATETIGIYPDDEILEITPWAYSAQSNGTGSFYKYGVSMEVTAGDQTVRIDAKNASNDPTIYTCVPAVIVLDDGPVVKYAEQYSRPGSELRPKYEGDEFTFEGPRNNYK